jgi:hypothetical protein
MTTSSRTATEIARCRQDNALTAWERSQASATTAVPPNQDVADAARQMARAAERGSLDRRAAGCVAVAADFTRTLASARKALDAIDPRMPDVRARAGEILTELVRTLMDGMPEQAPHG